MSEVTPGEYTPRSLTDYVLMVLNDRKYGHDIEWVRLNLRRNFLEQKEAAHDAEVARNVLRDAADGFMARLPDGTSNGRAYNSYTVARMLRDRADQIGENK